MANLKSWQRFSDYTKYFVPAPFPSKYLKNAAWVFVFVLTTDDLKSVPEEIRPIGAEEESSPVSLSIGRGVS